MIFDDSLPNITVKKSTQPFTCNRLGLIIINGISGINGISYINVRVLNVRVRSLS